MSKDIEFCIEIKDNDVITFTPYHQQLMNDIDLIWEENRRVKRTDPRSRYITVESGYKGKDGNIEFLSLRLSKCNVVTDMQKINKSGLLVQSIADNLLKAGINFNYTVKMTER